MMFTENGWVDKFFYQESRGESLKDDKGNFGYKMYVPLFKILDSVTGDMDLHDKLFGIDPRVLSISILPGFDIAKDLVMIDGRPLLLQDIENHLVEDDFLYIHGEFVNGLSDDIDIFILQSDHRRMIDLDIGSINLFTPTIDQTGKFVVMIKGDGTLLPYDFNSLPIDGSDVLRLTIHAPHTLLGPNQIESYHDRIIYDYGVGIIGGKLCYIKQGLDLYKPNKYSVVNRSEASIFIPYILTEGTVDSYYRKFFSKYKNKIMTDLNNTPDILLNVINEDTKDIEDIKKYYDRHSLEFHNRINELYKQSIGKYTYLVSNSAPKYFDVNPTKRITKNLVIDRYLEHQLSSYMLEIFFDNEDVSKYELYANRNFIHGNMMSIPYLGNTYVYIRMDQLFGFDIVKGIYDNVACDLYEGSFIQFKKEFMFKEDTLIETYSDAILNFIDIIVVKKRSDYARYEYQCRRDKKNIAEVPDIMNMNGVEVFYDGFLQGPDDYYLEFFGGVLCIIFKRVTDNTDPMVTITHYTDPITISTSTIGYTPEVFAMDLIELYDEVYLNGQLLTGDDIEILSVTKAIVSVSTLGYDINGDNILVFKHYVDKSVYETYKNTDHRDKLIELLNLTSTINSLNSIKKSIKHRQRYHELQSLQEYIFYHKYILNHYYENRQVFEHDVESLPFTLEEISALSTKYPSLLVEGEQVIFDSTDDYPSNVIFGDDGGIEGSNYDTKKTTKEFVESNPDIHINYTSTELTEDTVDDVDVFDANYIGQKIEE